MNTFYYLLVFLVLLVQIYTVNKLKLIENRLKLSMLILESVVFYSLTIYTIANPNFMEQYLYSVAILGIISIAISFFTRKV